MKTVFEQLRRILQKAIESIGENLAAAIEIFRDGVFGDGDGHV